jgi:hypothetical protein
MKIHSLQKKVSIISEQFFNFKSRLAHVLERMKLKNIINIFNFTYFCKRMTLKLIHDFMVLYVISQYIFHNIKYLILVMLRYVVLF